MPSSQLSQSTEDYLKNIWLLSEKTGNTAGVRALAKHMGLSPSTVSEAMKKLAEQGYVEHHRYSGITLTPTGAKIAIQMARKHRLIETYLVQQLGYNWDEVHQEAEALEHAVSDRFVEQIDKILGHPTEDPHGAPIPTATGSIADVKIRMLSEVHELGMVKIARVSDKDPEILAFWHKLQSHPGFRVRSLRFRNLWARSL
ncbi:metal-dependent transcriptional regulator [Arcanobacterium hippocoleae]|uniref:metal-dependent transcriptional regulator n=1 Tax=Arcanobacterium hippocoleae TaxID=149017 RepID=UPI0033401163